MKGYNRYSIENKMLVSFLSLFILSMLFIGAFSYWSTFQFYKESKIKQLEEKVEYLDLFYENLIELQQAQQMNDTVAQQKFLNLAKELFENEGIRIITNDGIVLFELESSNLGTAFSEEIIRERSLAWGWHLQFNATINPFSPFFINIQKYTILLVVMTSIIVIQIIIGLSHHFAQPLKDLVGSIEKIDLHSYPVVELSDRRDEIGILYNAFSRMLHRLEKSQNRIIKMQKLQKSIIESTSFGIISITYPSEQILMNQAAKRILKKENKLFSIDRELRNDGLYEKVLEVSVRTWQEREEQFQLYTNITDEQTAFVADIQTSLLYDENNQQIGVLCNLQDITEKVELEKRMIRLDRLASLGELAAGVAHEIRNPLTGIKANTQVLQKRLLAYENRGVLSTDVSPFMTRIVKEIDRLDRMIASLLLFAKPKQSKQEIINITAIITETIPIISKQMKEKDITIIRKEHIGLTLIFDYDQLKQILLNLLLNAVQASRMNSRIVIKTGSRNDSVYIAIEDSGIGMDTKTLEKIFNPFFTTNPTGTGLGLAVVHRLVEENQAKIHLRSQPEIGTIFEIEKLNCAMWGDEHVQ